MSDPSSAGTEKLRGNGMLCVEEAEPGYKSCSVHILRLRYSHSYKYLADPAIVVNHTDAVFSAITIYYAVILIFDFCGQSDHFILSLGSTT